MIPLARPQGAETAKRLREDTSVTWSGSRRRQTHSRRSRLRWHQSSSHLWPIQCQSPSSSPPWSLPADKWLSHSMEHFHLQPGPHQSRSRVQQGDTSIEERPRRKQARFDVDEELGDEPMLPTDLILFLAEDEGPEWDNTPNSPTLEPIDSPWPACSQPTHRGGARPKVSTKPSTDQLWLRSWSRCKEEPDPVHYPHRWIASEMSRPGTHPLVEGDDSQKEDIQGSGGKWQQFPGPTSCIMTGGGLQAASYPAEASR